MGSQSDIIVPAVLCVVFVLLGGAAIMFVALKWQSIFRRKNREDEETGMSPQMFAEKNSTLHSRESSMNSTSINSVRNANATWQQDGAPSPPPKAKLNNPQQQQQHQYA